MTAKTEAIEAIKRECGFEGYELTDEEAATIWADVQEKGWTDIRFGHSTEFWWDVMEGASAAVHARGK